MLMVQQLWRGAKEELANMGWLHTEGENERNLRSSLSFGESIVRVHQELITLKEEQDFPQICADQTEDLACCSA